MAAAHVTFEDQDGHPFTHVTEARSLKEAVSNAIKFFKGPTWDGPKPQPDTIYNVSVVGDRQTWKAMAAQAGSGIIGCRR